MSKEEVYFKLDTILRARVNSHGEVEKFVSWLGYPEKFNEWIPESYIIDL